MNCFLSVISIIVFIGFSGESLAQTDRDTAVARSVRVMQSKLGLTDDQVGAILLLDRRHNRQLDSLRQNKIMVIDERRRALVVIQNRYEHQLKVILNKEQWKNFKAIESDNRQEVLNRMKD